MFWSPTLQADTVSLADRPRIWWPQAYFRPSPFNRDEVQIDNDLLAVDQLMLFPNGDAVVTRDTETADRVLNDFMLDLDKSCGYRFKDALSERLYQSALSVEFDQKFVERARVFSIFRNAAERLRREREIRERSLA